MSCRFSIKFVATWGISIVTCMMVTLLEAFGLQGGSLDVLLNELFIQTGVLSNEFLFYLKTWAIISTVATSISLFHSPFGKQILVSIVISAALDCFLFFPLIIGSSI